MTRVGIRGAMWGVLFIWIGVMMVVNERPGVASIGAGVILLMAAFARRASGWRAGLVITIAGVLLLAFGIRDLSGSNKGIPLFAVFLIGFGAMVVARAISGGRWIKRNAGSITIRMPDDRL